jgi:hypothetical protein
MHPSISSLSTRKRQKGSGKAGQTFRRTVILDGQLELGSTEVQGLASSISGSLETLRLSNCTLLSTFWRALASHLPHLSYLELSGSVESSAMGIAMYLTERSCSLTQPMLLVVRKGVLKDRSRQGLREHTNAWQLHLQGITLELEGSSDDDEAEENEHEHEHEEGEGGRGRRRWMMMRRKRRRRGPRESRTSDAVGGRRHHMLAAPQGGSKCPTPSMMGACCCASSGIRSPLQQQTDSAESCRSTVGTCVEVALHLHTLAHAAYPGACCFSALPPVCLHSVHSQVRSHPCNHQCLGEVQS